MSRLETFESSNEWKWFALLYDVIDSKKNKAFFHFSERQELQQRSDDLRKEVTARIRLYKAQGKYWFIEVFLTYHPK